MTTETRISYMLRRVDERESGRNWAAAPSEFESAAVRALFERTLKPFFDKRDIRARINASKAGTFAELRDAVLSQKFEG